MRGGLPRHAKGVGHGGNEFDEHRGGIGATAVLDFADKWFGGGNAEDFGTVIGDLLCALMHFSDSVHVPFDTLVARARRHYITNVLEGPLIRRDGDGCVPFVVVP